MLIMDQVGTEKWDISHSLLERTEKRGRSEKRDRFDSLKEGHSALERPRGKQLVVAGRAFVAEPHCCDLLCAAMFAGCGRRLLAPLYGPWRESEDHWRLSMDRWRLRRRM